MFSSMSNIVVFLLLFELLAADALPLPKREKPQSLAALELDSEDGPGATVDGDSEEDIDNGESEDGNLLLLDRLASLNRDGHMVDPQQDWNMATVPTDEADGETSSEEDERIDDSTQTNSTLELLPSKMEAERTVAFVLITVFSVLCGTMAVVALIIFIGYYKRNINSFARGRGRGRVFSPSGHRRSGSTPEARLLPDDK